MLRLEHPGDLGYWQQIVLPIEFLLEAVQAVVNKMHTNVAGNPVPPWEESATGEELLELLLKEVEWVE